jgi:3-deoxy-D-manno-octulosonic acid (KDO) 8-phosphate synthase
MSNSSFKPTVIAGPCLAESYEIMEEVCESLKSLSDELGFQLIFKASFDKANRSSFSSFRGYGLEKTLFWFSELKRKYQLEILTDVHECFKSSL